MEITDKALLGKRNISIGQYTGGEIFSQTEAWAGALREVASKKNDLLKIISEKYQQVIFTGCGSTYYLSLAAASLFQSQTGLICRAVPAGELLLNPQSIYVPTEKILLFAISRSGSTSETVKAVRYFKDTSGGKVIAITTYEDRPLPAMSDLTFCIPSGQEKSIAQTRSFSSMFVTATAVAMIASKNDGLFNEMHKLPNIGRDLMEKYQNYAREIGENLDFDRFYFLGSGHRYGIACEANLKMKEMTQTHTEPYHFLEFRHGPKSMVNGKTAIIGLLSESRRDYEEKVLQEMHELGASIVSLAENGGDISFESGLAECTRTILYLPLLQIMAYYRSLAKGLDPDNPKNLSSVIYLD